MKINKNDIYKMYNNLNSLFTIFEDDFPQSQVKIMALYDTPKQKTLKYAYIKGSLFTVDVTLDINVVFEKITEVLG